MNACWGPCSRRKEVKEKIKVVGGTREVLKREGIFRKEL